MVKKGTVFMKVKENAYSTDKVKCEPQSFSLRGDSTNISPRGGFGLSLFSLDPKDCELDFFCHFLFSKSNLIYNTSNCRVEPYCV